MEIERGKIYSNQKGDYRKVIGIQTKLNNKSETVIDEIICLVVDSRAVPYTHEKKYYREKWFNSNYQLLT